MRIPDAYRPYGVKQKRDWGCWAACMESWTSTVYYWDTRSYDSFAREYGGAGDSLNAKSDAFGKLIAKYSLGILFFKAKELDLTIVHNTIAYERERGRFALLIEQMTPTASHARLIYNVDIEKDVIDVMEPRTGLFATIPALALEKTMLLSPVL